MIAWQHSYSILLLCFGQVALALGLVFLSRAIRTQAIAMRNVGRILIDHLDDHPSPESE